MIYYQKYKTLQDPFGLLSAQLSKEMNYRLPVAWQGWKPQGSSVVDRTKKRHTSKPQLAADPPAQGFLIFLALLTCQSAKPTT